MLSAALAAAEDVRPVSMAMRANRREGSATSRFICTCRRVSSKKARQQLQASMWTIARPAAPWSSSLSSRQEMSNWKLEQTSSSPSFQISGFMLFDLPSVLGLVAHSGRVRVPALAPGLARRATIGGQSIEHAAHRAVDLAACAEDHHLQVFQLDPQLFRGLAVAAFLDLDQLQRAALALREHGVEAQVEVQVGQVDALAFLAALALDGRVQRARRGDLGLAGEVVDRDLGAAAVALRAQVLEHRVAHDHRRPDAEGVVALGVEAVRVAVDVEEHLLQRIARVGLARVAAQARSDLHQQVLAVEFVQQPERTASRAQ